MSHLPVIVGFGGYNAAGRSSFHHAFRRTVLASLDNEKRVKTLLSLATLMNLVSHHDGHYIDSDNVPMTAEQVAEKYQTTIEQNTLIRRIHAEYFDVDAVSSVKDVQLNSSENSVFNYQPSRSAKNRFRVTGSLKRLMIQPSRLVSPGGYRSRWRAFESLIYNQPEFYQRALYLRNNTIQDFTPKAFN